MWDVRETGDSQGVEKEIYNREVHEFGLEIPQSEKIQSFETEDESPSSLRCK